MRKSVKSLVVCGEFPTFAQEKRYLTTMEGIFIDPAIDLEGRLAIESSYKKGRDERTLEIARKMKANGLSAEIIATTTGLTADEIDKL